MDCPNTVIPIPESAGRPKAPKPALLKYVPTSDEPTACAPFGNDAMLFDAAAVESKLYVPMSGNALTSNLTDDTVASPVTHAVPLILSVPPGG